MINQLKNKILTNPSFILNDDSIDENDDFSREIEPNTAFSFYSINSINSIITINEIIDKETNKPIWYFCLDFGCSELEDIQKQTEILEKIANDQNLVKNLIIFLKNETGLNFSTFTFKKPIITLVEEGVIEIEFY